MAELVLVTGGSGYIAGSHTGMSSNAIANPG